MANIKYLGFAKPSSSTPIYGQFQTTNSIDDLKIEVIKVLTKLKEFELRPDERQKVKSQFGCWYCKRDSRGMLYMALCSPNYPERHIYAAINQIRDHLMKLGDYETEPDSTLKLHCKEYIENMCKDFQELKGLDKVNMLGGLLDDVKSDMRRNTGQAIDNVFKVQRLQQKSQRMKENAVLFEETAQDVRHQMSRRKWVIRILAGISILSLALLLIIPIATHTVT